MMMIVFAHPCFKTGKRNLTLHVSYYPLAFLVHCVTVQKEKLNP